MKYTLCWKEGERTKNTEWAQLQKNLVKGVFYVWAMHTVHGVILTNQITAKWSFDKRKKGKKCSPITTEKEKNLTSKITLQHITHTHTKSCDPGDLTTKCTCSQRSRQFLKQKHKKLECINFWFYLHRWKCFSWICSSFSLFFYISFSFPFEKSSIFNRVACVVSIANEIIWNV